MSSVGIVEALDVFEQGDFGFGPGGKPPWIEPLAFEAGEEALAQGVVVAVAYRTHGGPDAGLPASLAKGHGGVLGPLVAVMDHPVGSALAQGHIQGVCDQLASQMVGHGPADDTATEGVYDHGEIEEAHMGRHVGDIGYPQPVPGWSGEVPADQIRGLLIRLRSPRGAHGSATRCSADSGHTHQASNAL